MNLFRVDPNDRAVLLVQLNDLEGILATEDDVVVAFVPPCYGSELWSRDVGDRTQVKPPDDSIDGVDHDGKTGDYGSKLDACGGWKKFDEIHCPVCLWSTFFSFLSSQTVKWLEPKRDEDKQNRGEGYQT